MKKMLFRFILAALILGLCLINAWAQDPVEEVRRNLASSLDQVVRLRTVGGGEFQGKLVSLSGERVEIQNGEGQILIIAVDQIAEVLVIDPNKSRDIYFQDAAANKLLLMPVGFGMNPGEVHVADQEIVVVSASYGFSKHFSLWAALSIPGALLNARFSTEIAPTVGFSAGSFVGVVFVDFGAAIVLPYLIASFGSPDQNFTIGVGAPFYTSSILDLESIVTGGVVALGGKIVLSRTASLVTENWIVVLTERLHNDWYRPGVYVIPAVAFRIAGSRFSWDVGVTMPFMAVSHSLGSTENDDYRVDWLMGAAIPIPILGFTYRIR